MAAHGQSTVAAILVAAGSGLRLHAPVPKAFVEVDGRTLLDRAAQAFTDHADIGPVVVVAPASHVAEARRLTGSCVVSGGATRQASDAAGLPAAPADAEFVIVHDVARPFVPPEVIHAVVAALRDGADAVVPVLPMNDTVRRVGADGALAGVVDRSQLVRVQTPQGFRRTVLVEAHRCGVGTEATDDAALVEALGVEVVAVSGDEEAFKITTPWDVACAEALAKVIRSAATPIPLGGEPKR